MLLIVSLCIDVNKFEIRGKKEEYSLKSFMKELSISQKEKLKKVYKLSFLYGVMMDTIRVLVIIVTIMTFKTSLNLGILTTIFSICTMMALYIFNKFYKNKPANLCRFIIIFYVILPQIQYVNKLVQYQKLFYNHVVLPDAFDMLLEHTQLTHLM